MINNKSPGLDGFTVEFFKFYWIDIGYYILNSLNYGYRTGSLSVTQKQGVITCIPKPNKSRISPKILEAYFAAKRNIQIGICSYIK